MSLSKQLLLLISLLFLIIFGINFILSFNNMKSYLEGDAHIHAQETATSLGVSLSPYMNNESDPIIKTTISAVFDMGYYQKMSLVNIDGIPLVLLHNEVVIASVPQWFIKFFPMALVSAESQITTGWNITGVIKVTLHPGYAYLKLYEQLQNSFYYSSIIFVLFISLLLIILRVTLAPLNKIDQMALRIASGNFEIIALPWAKEVRRVTVSMNMMSGKIEGIITGLNTKLKQIGEKLQEDDLTGLKKKTGFDISMDRLFLEDPDMHSFIFIIKLDSLPHLVEELNHTVVDMFIQEFVDVLLESSHSRTEEISVYRLLGSEFCLLIKDSNHEEVQFLAAELSDDFTKLARQYNALDIAHIGVVPFNPLSNTTELLAAANEAYLQAKMIGINGYYIRERQDQAKDIGAWKTLIFNIIDNKTYKISLVGTLKYCNTNTILMEDAFTTAFDNEGQPISMGTFISIATKFSKIVTLDKAIIQNVIKTIKCDKLSHAIAINVSTRTIKSPDFKAWLLEILTENSTITEQLVFSISAYAIVKDIDDYINFINFIHQYNAKVMIKRFDPQALSMNDVKHLAPDFIRLTRDLAENIANDKVKYTFVETLYGLGVLLNIVILAENVHSEQDFKAIKSIGLMGASR